MADPKESVDVLVQNVTKLTREKTALQTKFRSLSNTIVAGKETYDGLVREEAALRQKIKEISRHNMTLKSECDAITRDLESEKANQSSLTCTVDALNSKRNILEHDVHERDGKYVTERNIVQQCNMPETFNDAGARNFLCILLIHFLIIIIYQIIAHQP